MILDLITLPIRIGRCATRPGLRLTEQTFSTTIGAARWLIRAAVPAPTRSSPGTQPIPGGAPAHVSEETEFVESFAEPGAEEGAGAAVHVAEPLQGYRQMSAHEVIDRLGSATAEELAAVMLYERQHRARRTVLNAAEQQLRRASTAARGRG